MEDSKSLLPTLGRSANLSERWAPRKDTSRSFVHILQKYCNTFSNFKLLQSLFYETILLTILSSSGREGMSDNGNNGHKYKSTKGNNEYKSSNGENGDNGRSNNSGHSDSSGTAATAATFKS